MLHFIFLEVYRETGLGKLDFMFKNKTSDDLLYVEVT